MTATGGCGVLHDRAGDADSTLPAPTPAALTFGAVGDHGDVYYYLGGTKGTVLCFHGAGGSAGGWMNDDGKSALVDALIADGYSIVCPTSVDRTTAQWDPTNARDNPDIVNVDSLLGDLGIASSSKLFLVGHSNGGGFTSRYALGSARAANIKAIQVSNSSGLGPALALKQWRVPMLFNYADCDPIVDAQSVRKNESILASKSPAIAYVDNDLDETYATGAYETCHKFVATPDVTLPFFARF